jgi:hypothetical protein
MWSTLSVGEFEMWKKDFSDFFLDGLEIDEEVEDGCVKIEGELSQNLCKGVTNGKMRLVSFASLLRRLLETRRYGFIKNFTPLAVGFQKGLYVVRLLPGAFEITKNQDKVVELIVFLARAFFMNGQMLKGDDAIFITSLMEPSGVEQHLRKIGWPRKEEEEEKKKPILFAKRTTFDEWAKLKSVACKKRTPTKKRPVLKPIERKHSEEAKNDVNRFNSWLPTFMVTFEEEDAAVDSVNEELFSDSEEWRDRTPLFNSSAVY